MTSPAFLHLTGNRKAALPEKHPLFANGEPGGTRTRGPLLKRQMLYRLSYRLSSLAGDAAFLLLD
jgi:hypothetical protein